MPATFLSHPLHVWHPFCTHQRDAATSSPTISYYARLPYPSVSCLRCCIPSLFPSSAPQARWQLALLRSHRAPSLCEAPLTSSPSSSATASTGMHTDTADGLTLAYVSHLVPSTSTHATAVCLCCTRQYTVSTRLIRCLYLHQTVTLRSRPPGDRRPHTVSLPPISAGSATTVAGERRSEATGTGHRTRRYGRGAGAMGVQRANRPHIHRRQTNVSNTLHSQPISSACPPSHSSPSAL